MNLGALPELLLNWFKTQGTQLLQPAKAEPASPFKSGQEYQGSVVSQLPTGRHLVRVAGQELDMNLPANTKAGESVRLTFLNAGPRPTFLLNAPPVIPGQPVRLSAATQQVSALLRLTGSGPPMATAATVATAATMATSLPPTAATLISAAAQSVQTLAASAPVRISTASVATVPVPVTSTAAQPAATSLVPPDRGRLDAGPSPGPSAGVSRPIIASVSLLQGPVAGAPAYVAPLVSSGSSLPAEAIGGLRAAVPASTTLDAERLLERPTPGSQILPERLAQTVKESGLFYESHLAKWARGAWPIEKLLVEPQNGFSRSATPPLGAPELAGMGEEAARMAGRQLFLLEGGPLQWIGQVWPGQWMQWMIEERLDREGQGDDPAQRQWLTELSLHLPSLGGVSARLGLSGNQLQLNLNVDDTASLKRLHQALPELVSRLQAVGLQAACQVQASAHG